MSKKNKGLSARYKHNSDTKEGGNFGCFKYPSETKFLKLKEGRNKIVIVPYKVKSKNHPLVVAGEIEIGDLDFVMDIYIHRSIGGGDRDVVCLKRNFGKRCPVCEEANEKNEKGDEAVYNSLKASRRVYFNVIDVKDEDEEVKIFSMSHFLFLKPLTEEAEEGEDGNPIDYASQEDGKVISFRASEESFKKNKFFKCESFKFEDREIDITDKMIEEAVSFDDIMEVLTADEIEKILYGCDDDEEEERDNKRKKGNREDEDDDDEEDKPKKKVKEEEEEKPKKGKDCPSGFEFGKDVDKHKECEECKIWDDCDEAKFKSKKAK